MTGIFELAVVLVLCECVCGGWGGGLRFAEESLLLQ